VSTQHAERSQIAIVKLTRGLLSNRYNFAFAALAECQADTPGVTGSLLSRRHAGQQP